MDELTATERRALDAWTPIEPSPGFADRVLDARDARDARELDPARLVARRDDRIDDALDPRELDSSRLDQRREGRRLRVAAIVAACVAAAAIFALIVTRRGPAEERSTPIVERAARPPGPAPAPVASTGIRVVSVRPFEIRAPYGTTWVANDPGVRDVAPGTALRFGSATARIDAWGTLLEIESEAVVQIDSPTTFHLESGRIVVQAKALVSARVPGGSISLDGPGEAELVRTGAITTIEAVFGSVRVQGKLRVQGELRQQVVAVGDVVTLDDQGAVLLTRTSPTEVDVVVTPAATIVIHDPHPPTAVQFQLGATCPSGGIVELAKDNRYREIQRGGGGTIASLLLEDGFRRYRVRCMKNGTIGANATEGRLLVIRDGGSRPLPPHQPAVNRLDSDGRNYRISYSSVIPPLELRAKDTGKKFVLHLAHDGTEQTFESSLPTVIVPGSALRDGFYEFWFVVDGVKATTVTSLLIEWDDTAPQIRLDAPVDGKPWSFASQKRPFLVAGTAAAGWVLSFEGIPIPVDLEGRFAANVGALSTTRAFALRAERLERGVHYFLRRPR